MAKTLAIRALQRGVGSMDYVDSLLLMEPEDESKNSDQEPNVADDDDASPLCVPPASTQVIDQEPVPEWCNCSCCRAMPQDMENKCCGRRNCVSQTRRFRKLCLDTEYLLLCAKNTADIRNDWQDSSSRTFHKAAYRNYFRHPWLPWKKEEESCSLLLCTLHSPTLTFCHGYIYGVPTAMKCPRRKNYSNSLWKACLVQQQQKETWLPTGTTNRACSSSVILLFSLIVH